MFFKSRVFQPETSAAPTPPKRRWSSRLILIGLLAVPLLLPACASLFMGFESDFVSSDTVERHTFTVQTESGPVDVSYLRAGDPDGQRVIFIHGTPGDAAGSWLHFLENTPPGFDYIAVDRPGFGRTKPDRAFTSLQDQADALAPLLKTNSGTKPILVGHSLGGPVATTIAAHYTEQVRALIPLAAALDPDLEEVQWIQYLGLVPPFSWTLPDAMKHSNDELIALEAELRQHAPHLSRITAPVTIIHGTEDPLVPYANVSYMEKHLSASKRLTLVRLDGQNHFLPWNSAEIIQSAILELSN